MKRTTQKNILILASLLTCGIANSCGGKQNHIPDTEPEVHGYLTNIKKTAVNGEHSVATVLVAPLDGIKTKYPKASIKIGVETLIKTRTGREMKIEELREGHEIEAWLEGDILKTVPIQASAKAIRVIE